MSVSHPPSSALLDAARWVEALLSGPLAIGIATLAVAGIGFSLLTGRMAIRRGAVVAVGCFLLFGASSIARGLLGVAGTAVSERPVVVELPPAPAPIQTPPPPQNVVSDPYAGATVAG